MGMCMFQFCFLQSSFSMHPQEVKAAATVSNCKQIPTKGTLTADTVRATKSSACIEAGCHDQVGQPPHTNPFIRSTRDQTGATMRCTDPSLRCATAVQLLGVRLGGIIFSVNYW